MKLQNALLMWRWKQALKHNSPVGIVDSIWARRMALTLKLRRWMPRGLAWWIVGLLPDELVPKYRIE